jgi:hypothetical protein
MCTSIPPLDIIKAKDVKYPERITVTVVLFMKCLSILLMIKKMSIFDKHITSDTARKKYIFEPLKTLKRPIKMSIHNGWYPLVRTILLKLETP